MSIAPCQVCGGTGFIDGPTTTGGSREDVDDVEGLETETQALGGGEVEKIPCPVCAGSGNNTGI